MSKMDIEKIRDLVDRATSARNKAEAKPYIQRLRMLCFSANLNRDTRLDPYTSGVFSSLLSSLEAASGQVRNKNHWMGCVEQDIYKLETICGLGKDESTE